MTRASTIWTTASPGNFTEDGQRQIGRLRVGIVGCGGTGSVIVQSLAYLGCRDFVLIDHDHVEMSNMNRLVIAGIADVETPKVMLARRMTKSIAPGSIVLALELDLRDPQALDTLKGVDVLFGCVDNDGARLVMNELALACGIPCIDLAVGIEAEGGSVVGAGGRLAVVLPGGPCLQCMRQIDVDEATYFLSPPTERERNLDFGYVSGVDVPSPAVISLNTQIAATAVNEFAVLTSGLRPVNAFADFDLLGTGRKSKGQWMSPVSYKKDPDCIQCSIAGAGDRAGVEARYALGETGALMPVSPTPSN